MSGSEAIVSHFSDEETPMREWIYGVGRPKGNEDIYIARYERHNREVMEYFKDRSEQLLVLNITAGEGWTKLCPFLNEQIPSISFPCANIASEKGEIALEEELLVSQVYAAGEGAAETCNRARYY